MFSHYALLHCKTTKTNLGVGVCVCSCVLACPSTHTVFPSSSNGGLEFDWHIPLRDTPWDADMPVSSLFLLPKVHKGFVAAT